MVGFGYYEDDSNPTDIGALQPDGLWLQDDDGTFVLVDDAWDTAGMVSTRGLLLVDLNRDGWLDMVKREGKWHDRMYSEEDSGETYYNLEGDEVTGDAATNLMLESISEGKNGGVGWPYKGFQDVSADVIEWVMHEVGAAPPIPPLPAGLQ